MIDWNTLLIGQMSVRDALLIGIVTILLIILRWLIWIVRGKR